MVTIFEFKDLNRDEVEFFQDWPERVDKQRSIFLHFRKYVVRGRLLSLEFDFDPTSSRRAPICFNVMIKVDQSPLH